MKTPVCGVVDRIRQSIALDVLADAAYQDTAATRSSSASIASNTPKAINESVDQHLYGINIFNDRSHGPNQTRSSYRQQTEWTDGNNVPLEAV
ncbi:hypothetical protein [Ferrimicrobium acidiphilum]|uniref:hypothetical protein n=1 Tax=Ferrimicrobium acidiphilum TaxID=121039 RepID=UPI0012E065E2|nr:hypothetical protein [Ferrimicrobium acidiphilum]